MEPASQTRQLREVNVTYTGNITGKMICSVCGGIGHGPQLHLKGRRTTKAKNVRKAKKALKQKKAKANAQRSVKKDIETKDSSNYSLGDFLALAPIEVIVLMMSYIITQRFDTRMNSYLMNYTLLKYIMRDVICEMNEIARTSKSIHKTLTSGQLKVELHKSLYCVSSGMHMMRKLLEDSYDFVKHMDGTAESACLVFTVENMSGEDIMISPICARYIGNYRWHTIKHRETIQCVVSSSYSEQYAKQCRQLIVSPGAKQLVGTTPETWYRSYKLTCPIRLTGADRTRPGSKRIVLEKVTIGEFRDAKTPPANYKKIKKVTILDQIRLLGEDPDSFIRRRVDEIQRVMERDLDTVLDHDRHLRRLEKEARSLDARKKDVQDRIDVTQRSIQANIQMLESLGNIYPVVE